MSRTKKIAQIVMILIIGFAFGSGIASAEYLGPDRVYQVKEYEACDYGVWAQNGAHCVDENEQAVNCIICGWECDPGWACEGADYSYKVGVRLVEHIVTHTDPEATVAITPNCGAWGDASWCLQPSSVTITANEPVSGEQITLIEGTQNGDAFACAANTCTVNIMGEGSNAFTYWALSSYGDSSRMGTHTALQDTIAPEINASVTGTMGDNGWFVSNAVLSVAFTDTLPGSGISSSSALFNGILTDVSSPVTITEGVYNIQLDTRDAAGWTASASQTISVDTTAPAVTANQPPIEVANSNVTGGGYVNGSVVFTGTCSDATSGVDRIEISTDGQTLTSIAPNADGTWTLDWDSSMLSDGTYTPVISAVDAAGNRTDITMQPLTMDNSAPAMSMTGAWYIWDSGHIEVFDSRVGIEHIELSVRDGQNRWPAREWSYDTAKLVMDLQWDRKFGDGTVAPTGDYEVLLQAWDQLGNGRYITSRIYIPEAGATAVIPLGDVVSGGTFEDTPTPMAQQTQTEESGVIPAAPAVTEEAPTPASEPEPSSTPSSLSFSSPPVIPASGESKSTTLPVDPNLLTGAAALAAAASATAYSLQRKEEKEAERKRQEAESRAEAMAKVNAAQAVKEANAYAYNMIKKKYGDVSGSDISNNSGLKELYNYHKNNKLGIPTAPPDEETLSEIDEFLQGVAFDAFVAAHPDIAAMINDHEQLKEENDIRRYTAEAARYTGLANEYYAEQAAKEYSNQVKLFNAIEEASIKSFADYKENMAYHEKMDKVEEETENSNVITPNLTFKENLANFLNSASAGLGILHDMGRTTAVVTKNAVTSFVTDPVGTIQTTLNTMKNVVINGIDSSQSVAAIIVRNVEDFSAKVASSVQSTSAFIVNSSISAAVTGANYIKNETKKMVESGKENLADGINYISPGVQIFQDFYKSIVANLFVNGINRINGINDFFFDGESFVYSPDVVEEWNIARSFVPSLEQLSNKELFTEFDSEYIVYNGWANDVGLYTKSNITTIGTGENLLTENGFSIKPFDFFEFHKGLNDWSISLHFPTDDKNAIFQDQGVNVEYNRVITFGIDKSNPIDPKVKLKIGDYVEYTNVTNQATVENGILIEMNRSRQRLAAVAIPVAIAGIAYLGEAAGTIELTSILGGALGKFGNQVIAYFETIIGPLKDAILP